MDDEGFIGPVEEVRFGCVNGIVRQIGSDEFFIGKWGVWRVVKVGLEDALVTFFNGTDELFRNRVFLLQDFQVRFRLGPIAEFEVQQG